MSSQPLNSIAITTRLAAGLVILAVAGGICAMLVFTRATPHTADTARAVPRVLVMEARPVTVARIWTGYGTARAMDAADVPARVTATAIEVPDSIQPGRLVAQGELLIRLDDTDFQNQARISTHAVADIDAQLAQLNVEQQGWTDRVALLTQAAEIARREAKRLEDAQASEAAKMREVDAARTALILAEQALINARETLDRIPPRRAGLEAQRLGHEATLANARLNVDRCNIVSPIAGVLQAVDVDEGENLSIGERVARVVNLERIEVPLLLPAGARPHIAVNATVTLTATGSSSATWNGRIARISPEDDQSTRTLTAYVEMVQSDGSVDHLAPGQFVWGEVSAGEYDARWVVPRRAVLNDRVMLVERGVVRSRSVDVDYHTRADVPELGLPDTQWIVLKNELSAGTLIVVEGSRTLGDGAHVLAIPASQVAGATSNLPAIDEPRESAQPSDSDAPSGGVPQ